MKIVRMIIPFIQVIPQKVNIKWRYFTERCRVQDIDATATLDFISITVTGTFEIAD